MEESTFFDRVLQSSLKGYRHCIILRGLPGRGKSTCAANLYKLLMDNGVNVTMSAADDFMVDDSGAYSFSFEKLGYCHSQCVKTLVNGMQRGDAVVIQHNTNTLMWESIALRGNAEDLGYLVTAFEPKYSWNETTDESLPHYLKNSHHVGEDKINEMRKRKQDFLPLYSAYWLYIKDMLDSLPISRDVLSQWAYEAQLPGLVDIEAFPSMLHMTCDFFANTKADLTSVSSDLLLNSLDPGDLRIAAIFADERGVGVLLDKTAIPPLFRKYMPLSLEEAKLTPHLTLFVSEGQAALKIGRAAYEFEKLLQDYRLSNPPLEASALGYRMETLDTFRAIVLDEPVSVEALYGSHYGSSVPNKFSHFRWQFQSKKEELICLELLGRRDVSVVETLVPSAILPGNFRLVDFKVSPAKGRGDDEVYNEIEFLRKFLPRGLCYLISGDNKATKVLVGMSKFTGHEDEVAPSTLPPPPTSQPPQPQPSSSPSSLSSASSSSSSSSSSSVVVARDAPNITEGITFQDPSRFYIRPLSTATSLSILAMEKANGEAAHASVVEIDSVRCVIVGSKNVHIAIRLDHPEDIQLYEGPRYKFASEIASFFMDMLSQEKMEPGKKLEYVNKLLSEQLTCIFEYEDPNHCHIVPLYQRRLKFITFTKSGIRPSPELDSLTASGTTIITAATAAAVAVHDRASLAISSPQVALEWVRGLGMDTVWSYTWEFSKLEDLQTKILTDSEERYEGCVLYFLDGTEVLGLCKMKNAFYICSRAIREKVCGFVSNLSKAFEGIVVQINKQVQNLLNCKTVERRTEVFNKIFERQGEGLAHKFFEVAMKSKNQILKRFQEMCLEQVLLKDACQQQWVTIAHLLIDKLQVEYNAVVQDCFVGWLEMFKAVVLQCDDLVEEYSEQAEDGNTTVETASSGSSESILSSEEQSSTELPTQMPKRMHPKELYVNKIKDSINEMCALMEVSTSRFVPQTIRDKWPFVWEEHLSLVKDDFGILSIVVQESQPLLPSV